MHPVMVTTLVLLLVGLVFGSIADLIHQVSMDTYFRWMRELASWPLFMFVGYRMIKGSGAR